MQLNLLDHGVLRKGKGKGCRSTQGENRESKIGKKEILVQGPQQIFSVSIEISPSFIKIGMMDIRSNLPIYLETKKDMQKLMSEINKLKLNYAVAFMYVEVDTVT